MTDREYIQHCIDNGIVPEKGVYVLDGPVVVRNNVDQDWSGITLKSVPPVEAGEGDK